MKDAKTTVIVRTEYPDRVDEVSVSVDSWGLHADDMAMLIRRALIAIGYDPETAKECSE